ncbi:MAG: hypothetical protein K0M63_05925 [Weeksellaceae bacterium]|nr:hypothetical protein [Weeksellaceae bacterium]
MKRVFLSAVICTLALSCAVQEKHTLKTAEAMEATEFAELMVLDSINKQETTAESVDLLLNENPVDNRISLLVNNNTDCNIILRFSGDQSYSLPIRKNFRNFIVIEKGNYSVGANLCNSRYVSSKTLTQSINITISERE